MISSWETVEVVKAPPLNASWMPLWRDLPGRVLKEDAGCARGIVSLGWSGMALGFPQQNGEVSVDREVWASLLTLLQKKGRRGTHGWP